MEDNTLPAYHQSIFHQLFEHASDIDCKLLLLDQILEFGDVKDLALLEKLKSSENPKIRDKALKTYEGLIHKLRVAPEDEEKRFSMNLCFIYDEFNVRPAQVDQDLDLNFELNLDLFEMDD